MTANLETGKQIMNNLIKMRKYFELGCLCILDGKLEKCSDEVTDDEAIKYYMEGCKCSRHPEYAITL